MMPTQTKTIVIISGVCFFAALGTCLLLWHVVGNRGDDLSVSAETLAQLRAEEQAAGALARLVEDTVEERIELENYILRRDNAPLFITDLERYAREQGVVFSTSNLRETETEGVNEIKLTLKLEGSYDAMIHMHKILESIPYHSYVSSLSLTRGFAASTGAASWQSEAELTVTLSDI